MPERKSISENVKAALRVGGWPVFVLGALFGLVVGLGVGGACSYPNDPQSRFYAKSLELMADKVEMLETYNEDLLNVVRTLEREIKRLNGGKNGN